MRKFKLLTFVLSVAMLCAFASCTIPDGDFVFVPSDSSVEEEMSGDDIGGENGETFDSETIEPPTSETEEPELPVEVISDPLSFSEGFHTLENYKITATNELVDCLYVTGTANVTIESGYYDGGQTVLGGAGNTVIFANENAVVTINGGNFRINGLAVDDIGHIDLIYAKDNAQIIINGGVFEGKDDTVWLLNCKDGQNAKIIVCGGTFINWNPATASIVGSKNYVGVDEVEVAEGYEVIAETKIDGNVWYTVQAIEVNADNVIVE